MFKSDRHAALPNEDIAREQAATARQIARALSPRPPATRKAKPAPLARVLRAILAWL